MKKIVLLSFISLLCWSCTDQKTPVTFVEKVQAAHRSADYRALGTTEMELNIQFGGQTVFDGVMTLSNDSQYGKLVSKSGETILYANDQVYTSPGATFQDPRFHAYTWAYFFQLPYKMADQGTIWNDYPSKVFKAQELTFQANTGDAPDDWYRVFADSSTLQIDHVAYIVTAHGPKEEVEKDPHAIRYQNYQLINELPIAQKWTFHNWNEEDGLGAQIGMGSISNVKFSAYNASSFEVPEGYTEIKAN